LQSLKSQTATDYNLHGCKILIAEDDFFIAMDLQTTLESAGVVVVGPAQTVSQALNLLATENLDAAILDVRLGRDLVWPVAECLAKARVPFLFHTGQSDAELRDTPWARHMILTKPSRQQMLISAMQKLLRVQYVCP